MPSARGVQSALERELDKPAAKAGESAGRSFGDRFKSSTGKSLDEFGKTALIGAVAFGAGLLGVSKAAGNLDAALAANSQVLKGSAVDVQRWADTSVESVGLSERATLQAATAFGQLGKVAGLTGQPLATFSIDMVKLAADMSAFADVPAAQALDDLRAAFAGSTETVQKYNIFLNETELKAALFRATGEQVTGVLTAQQRVLATQAALLEQTADIQGQAAREAGSLQRAEDNLRASFENTAASIGTSTLPAVTGLVNGLSSGVGAVGSLNDATGGLVGGFLLVGTAALGSGGSIALASDKVGKAVGGFRNLSRTMQTTSIAAAGITAAVVAGFAIYDNWRRKQEAIRARTDEVATALGAQVFETIRLAQASSSAAGEVDGLTVAQQALSAVLAETGEDGATITEALGALGLSASDALDVLTAIRAGGTSALADLADRANLTAVEVEFLQLALAESGGEFRKWAQSTASSSVELAATNPRLEELGRLLRSTRDGAAVISPEMFRITDALEQLNTQAGRNDLDDMIDRFLNAQAAGAGLTEAGQELRAELVQQARDAATASDGTENLITAFQTYNSLLLDLTPVQLDLVSGVEQTGAAIGTTAAELATLNTVAASSLSVLTGAERGFERAAAQADAFGSAIDRLIGTQLDLQSSGDALLDGFAELSTIVTETAAGTDGFSTSLDAFSDAGRANREVVRSQVDRILDYSRSMLDAGRSVDEASAAALANTGQLERQLVAFGLTESEAADYVATLGLTPESIETAVELYNAEAARERVESLLDSIDEIPAEVATQVQALIDEGNYAEAERRLSFLARDRFVPIRTVGSPSANTFSALGRYVDSPLLTWVGEGNRAEAILPLENPARMAELLSDPRIFGPVVSALPTTSVPAPAGARSVTGMHVEQLTVESPLDLDTLYRASNTNLAMMGVPV